MKLKQTIQNKELFKSTDDQLSSLSTEENLLISDFINALLDEDNCQLIFRGERKDHAYRKSGIARMYEGESEDSQFRKHGNSIFYIGSKAGSYLFKFEDIEFPINLNNTESELFNSIHKEFKQNINHPSLTNESDFTKYFTGDALDFTSKIMSLDNSERIRIKYYYLWLLHVLGDTKYKKYSNFISTSKNYEIANEFGNDELVYVGWIPRPIKERSVYLGSLIQLSKRLTKLQLPVYSDEPYPKEDEISLIGGLFPHYIFGIYNQSKEIVLVNDYLFSAGMLEMIKHGLSNKIIEHGIGIDQSNFSNSEFLKISEYKRHLTYTKGEGYRDNE